MIRSKEVLPTPDGPVSANVSPGESVRAMGPSTLPGPPA